MICIAGCQGAKTVETWEFQLLNSHFWIRSTLPDSYNPILGTLSRKHQGAAVLMSDLERKKIKSLEKYA